MIPTQDIIVIAAGAVALLVAVVAGTWLWKRDRPAAKAQSLTPPPCRITLASEASPAWKGEKQMARYAEQFRALGFQTIGAFRIPELDSQRILALFHPAQRFFACVYDSKTNPTFEIFARFNSDNALMGTNCNWTRDIEQRPGSVMVRLANATPTQVLEALKQHEKAADRAAIAADEFAPAFLDAYVKNFNWRLKKCEISRDQIRMDARQEGRALTAEQVDELYRAQRAAYVAQLQDACRAQYRDDNEIDRADWQKLQNRLIAIPETYDLKEVINAVSYAAPSALNEKQLFALQRLETSLGDDGIVLIEKIISKNIAELGLKKIADVTEPVRAWIVTAAEVEADAPAEEEVAQENAAAA